MRLRYAADCVVEPAMRPGPAIQLENIESGTARVVGEPVVLPPTGQNRFRRGDVLFSKLRPYLAKSLLVDGERQGSGEFLCIRPRVGTEPRYLLYATLSHPWLEHAAMSSYGTKMPRTSWAEMSSLHLYLPAPGEQRRIAHFLDDRVARIDQIIAARSQQISALAGLRMSGMDDIVRGAGPPARLGRHLTLGAVGVVVNPSTYFRDEGVPFVHGYNVRDGFFDLTDLKRMSPEDSQSLGRSALREDDVLVVRAGYPGRAAVVTADLAGGNCASVLLLRPGPDLAARWLAAFFNSPVGKFQVALTQYGAAQGVVNLSDVVAFEVPLPSLKDQESRLERLADLEREWVSGNDHLTRQIAVLNEYKQALITAAVTGELDVTTAGSGIPG